MAWIACYERQTRCRQKHPNRTCHGYMVRLKCSVVLVRINVVLNIVPRIAVHSSVCDDEWEYCHSNCLRASIYQIEHADFDVRSLQCPWLHSISQAHVATQH